MPAARGFLVAPTRHGERAVITTGCSEAERILGRPQRNAELRFHRRKTAFPTTAMQFGCDLFDAAGD